MNKTTNLTLSAATGTAKSPVLNGYLVKITLDITASTTMDVTISDDNTTTADRTFINRTGLSTGVYETYISVPLLEPDGTELSGPRGLYLANGLILDIDVANATSGDTIAVIAEMSRVGY